MYILSQNRDRLVNLENMDCLKVEGKGIYAQKDDRKILLGVYRDDIAATSEYESIIDSLENGTVIVMD